MARQSAFGVRLSDLDIAIVERSAAMVEVMRPLVSGLGVGRVRAYCDSRAALAGLGESPPHLVMADWDAAPLAGRELVEAIRAREAAPLCFAAVIVMTGRGSEDMVREAFHAGANQVLERPVAPTTVLGRLVWLQRDGREFTLDGGRYVVAGAESAGAPQPAGDPFAHLGAG